MIKKTIKASFLLAFVLIFAILHITMSDIITAKADGVAEITMELSTGRVLSAKNERIKLPMASTTKIMTALIVAEDCNLDEVVAVPDKAVGTEGSSIYLKNDEKLTIRDLLYGLMLRSGNDAAVALAIIHSGSTESFVEKMNEKARAIGANDTHFCNPNGLPAEGHYTTAYDLCLIARYAMNNQIFKEVVSTTNYTGDFRSFTNKNKLLYSFSGANGIKTGYTDRAGRCLVSSAARDNMDVICVVLNCYDMYERSAKLLTDAFESFSLESISTDKIFSFNGTPCILSEVATVCVRSGEQLDYKILPAEPNDEGIVAKLQISDANDLIFTANLYSIK